MASVIPILRCYEPPHAWQISQRVYYRRRNCAGAARGTTPSHSSADGRRRGLRQSHRHRAGSGRPNHQDQCEGQPACPQRRTVVSDRSCSLPICLGNRALAAGRVGRADPGPAADDRGSDQRDRGRAGEFKQRSGEDHQRRRSRRCRSCGCRCREGRVISPASRLRLFGEQRTSA